MSLPDAPKDISNHPKTVWPFIYVRPSTNLFLGSITDPVLKADKDADVDQKVHWLTKLCSCIANN
jgi:hypothetical protein